MKKSSVKPQLFSRHFNVSPALMAKAGVFDPSLNVDTLLFPDPMLLETSSHPEMQHAKVIFDEHFEKVRRLLLHSKGVTSHIGWKSAYRMLLFPEIPGTCLGYGANSISGSGAGPKMTNQLMATGYQIAELGIDDPDLFMAMGLFEEDFGPDLIGDMFTNVCFKDIIAFNQRVYKELSVATKSYSITLKSGAAFSASFAQNPTANGHDVPIILVPLDILRDLPVAIDWRGVQAVSEENKAFRDSLNSSVSSLWSRKSLESKSQLKTWALSSSGSFGDLLDMIHGMDGKPYDFAGDKLGELVWRDLYDRVISEYPFTIESPAKLNHNSALEVVDKIIEQFRHLIEDRDLWRDLYTDDGTPRLEKAAQRLFYMVALSYCEANNLDITPEAETGRGPVDFKFSNALDGRILVEIKLSKNSQLVTGYTKQLDIYNTAERSFDSRYLVIDVGSMGKKMQHLNAARDKQIAENGNAPKIIKLNGLERLSASKAKI